MLNCEQLTGLITSIGESKHDGAFGVGQVEFIVGISGRWKNKIS